MAGTRLKVESNYQQQAATFSKYGLNNLSAIYELIDNSLGPKANSQSVTIELYVDNSNKHSRYLKVLKIKDDGKGIPYSLIAKAMGLGVLKGNTMHEHGVGMKSSIAYFGHHNLKKGLDYIETDDGSQSYKIKDIIKDELDIAGPKQSTGVTFTEVSIRIADEMNVSTKFYKSKWAKKLGRRYCKQIIDGKKIVITRYDNKTKTKLDSTEVKAESPPYFNHTNSSTTPFITHKFATTDYEATLILGNLKDDFEGNGAWNKATTGGGGIDIVIHDRVVAEQQMSPLEKCGKMSHPKYNGMIGQLVVVKGVSTVPKKTDVQSDEVFKLLQEDIKSEWQKKGWSGYYPDSGGYVFDENKVRDNVTAQLKLAPYNWTGVGKEKSTWFGTQMDVVGKKPGNKDKTIIEIKVKEITTQDVNQLVGYMIAEGVTDGVLIGPSLSSNGNAFKDHVRSKLKFSIDFWNYNSGAYVAFTNGAAKV